MPSWSVVQSEEETWEIECASENSQACRVIYGQIVEILGSRSQLPSQRYDMSRFEGLF